MVSLVALICLVGLSLALALLAYRAFVGPTVVDRVVALDAGSVVLIAMVVVGSVRLRETQYLDYALVLGVLSFVATIAYARYLERGAVIE